MHVACTFVSYNKVVHEVTKGYPTFQTKVLDPYPPLNGGQHLGALEACPDQTVTLMLLTLNLLDRHADGFRVLGGDFNLWVRKCLSQYNEK